jgi:HEAT repeat protein
MDDTIWPWNGVIGQQPDELASRPPVNLSGPFKASGKKNIWPGQNTTIMPTNGDLIDYSATLPANMDMGFAYDTVPFGAQDNLPSELAMFSFDSKQSPNGGGTSASQSKQQKHDTKLINTYHSKAATQKSRQKALASMDIKYNQEHAKIADNLISNPKANEEFRIIALSQLAQTDDPDAVKAAAKILMDDNDGGESLDVHAVHTLNYLRMFNKLDSQEKKLAHTALQDALNDDRTKVKAAALKVLSGSKSKMAIAKLQAHLRDKTKRVMDLPTTIHLLAGAAGESSYQHLRPFIKHANVDARVAAVTQLGSDKQSTQSITALLQDKNQPYKVRSAAAGSLLYHDKNFAAVALALIKKSDTPNRLKQRLKRALRKHISELNPTRLSIAKRQKIRQIISHLSSRNNRP